MFAITGESERVLRLWLLLLLATTLLRRIPFAALTIRVGSNGVAFGVLRLFDGLFALRDLSGEGGLGGGLACRGGFLGSVSLGRALRGGQVSELQIHGTDRHDPVIPLVRYVLL